MTLLAAGRTAGSHVVPVDVGQEKDLALRRTGFGRAGRRDRGLGHVGQSDVPRRVDVKFAAGRAHDQGTRLGGRQQGAPQRHDEVIPEQLSYVPAHVLLAQVEPDARLANCSCHPLVICFTLEDAFGKNKTKQKNGWKLLAVILKKKRSLN